MAIAGIIGKVIGGTQFFYDDGIMKVDFDNKIVFKKSLVEIFL